MNGGYFCTTWLYCLHYQLNDNKFLVINLCFQLAMAEPNEVRNAHLASKSIPQRRKPRKLRHKRPVSHGLDKEIEKEAIVDTPASQRETVIFKTSEDESNFKDALEEDSSVIKAQLQPVPERQRQTNQYKPFRDEEEGDMAEGGGAPATAERQRLRRGRHGDRTLIQSNIIDGAGRTVGESQDLVLNRAEGVVGRVTDTSGRVLSQPSEQSDQPKKEKDEPLKLRLDLNLDLEIQLKAKISGDVTLTLLLVYALSYNEAGNSLQLIKRK